MESILQKNSPIFVEWVGTVYLNLKVRPLLAKLIASSMWQSFDNQVILLDIFHTEF